MGSTCCLSVYPFTSVHLSVCVPPIVGKLVRSPCVASSNSFVFYAVRVLSKESTRLVLPRTFV
jgi:hypothetical protein